MERQESHRLQIERKGPLVKVGSGELGGKALSFPFLQTLVDLEALSREIAPHQVTIPETWVLATGIFDEFMTQNNLERCLAESEDARIRTAFLGGRFSPEVLAMLQSFLESHSGPIAVRSSALTEDAANHPAAGLYCTFMIPNRGSDEQRLLQLADAIKLVFASLYSPEARQYLRFHNIPHEDEKMAVILEEVVGQAHGDLFYPLLSGVAQSINFFPVANMQPEDGVATVALGLGRKIVDGHAGMRFCPKYPTIRPQFRHIADIRANTQEDFDTVDLSKGALPLTGEETETLATHPIFAAAPSDLEYVCSLLDDETGTLVEFPTGRQGEVVLTYNRFLREQLFPLPSVIRKLLDATQYGFGSPVEIEFALRMEETEQGRSGTLYLLQARAMAALKDNAAVEIPEVSTELLVLSTDKAMGHGSLDNVRHIIFVEPREFGPYMSRECAREIAEINEQLAARDEPYLLLGPGRWGSCNIAVGVPITYPQVSHARLIAELSTDEMRSEPSQGSHFFHNVVSSGLFYLTVDEAKGGFVDLEWLRTSPNHSQTRHAKLIHVTKGISIRVNAQTRQGVAYRQ